MSKDKQRREQKTFKPGEGGRISPAETVRLEPGVHAIPGGQIRTKYPVLATVSENGDVTYEKPDDAPTIEVEAVPVERLIDDPAKVLTVDRIAAKPPADVAMAVHHLRRAGNALAGDALRPVVEHCAQQATWGALGTALNQAIVIASALGLDHNAKAATADVRAAIEALR